MFGIGYPELLVILFIILLIYGGAKLPELAKGMGKAVNEFKKAKDGVEDSIKKELSSTEKPNQNKPEEKDKT
ncbi:MAG TPA: twin-arginine translocase TatA/TatE family subunit [Lentisphaeria bacterium]|nr:MAG: preprotein translocase subunit TatA [Lentisphaerae bacterium GWF2_49_21]HBC89335.1 twin-arginine translocase TatA/TatE family subunit [Lentisphaeria bacterium]